jgi:hypothetical protein
MPYVSLKEVKCWCGTPFACPEELANSAINDGHTIYCPHGHSVTWKETEKDKLRRDLNRATQRLAEKDDEIAHQRQRAEQTERRLSATRGQVTKIKNRVGRGVCPCCNRSFSDLQRHMASKHSDYATSEIIEAAE